MTDQPTTPAKKAAKKATPAKKPAAAKKSPDAISAPGYEGPGARPAQHLAVGELVSHTYFDPYTGPGGQDVTKVGLVTAVDELGARVAFLESSDPIPPDDLTVL